MKAVSITILFLTFFIPSLKAQVSGIVNDENNSPLPGAIVWLQPDSLVTSTDQNGEFTFSGIKDGPYTLLIVFNGYVTDTIQTTVHQGLSDKIEIQLTVQKVLLRTIEVTEHAKQEEVLSTEHIHEDFFQRNIQGSFAKTLDKLPGISTINVGVGIAKPVIRGLSSNRIIVNHQGIKQESQQWGSDHGLEIDQFDVEQIEIIKGPGSLQYGSDGLGGVINILPAKLLPANTFAGSVQGLYKTNNDHWGGSAHIAFSASGWFMNARYSRQGFADYHVPASIFNYNGFELPIFNERLKNTAGNEDNISISAGLSRDWGITRITFNHYSLDAGLFSGAVGVPRAYVLTHDGNYRDIDVPSQAVDHYRLSLNHTLLFGSDHFTIDIGYQHNIRHELSQPEFHSIPISQLEDPNDKLAISLDLQTFSIASHYEDRLSNSWKNTYGGNVQWQKNRRKGFEHLLPDFNTFRAGLYSITQHEITEHWLINGGLRLDIAQNLTEHYRQYVWDSNENIKDSLISPATDDLFFNWSASVGSSLTLHDEKWILKGNLGKSFRVPYPAETVSNGIHHGTFRHEIGSTELTSEHGYQIDLGIDYTLSSFTTGLALYFNYFDNYIYLGPTFPARFSPLPEAGQIFQYRQDDAIYTGFEFQWDWKIYSKMSIDQAIEFVQSYNPKTKLALPFTPQPSIRTDLVYSPFELKWLRELELELSYQYHLPAKGRYRIDRSEQPTPGYQLVDIGVSFQIPLHRQSLELSCQVQNFFNTAYLANLSRYRILNIPEPGRNFVISARYLFDGAI